MTKKHFMYLVLTVVAGLCFSLGMCMCLLPQWQAFKLGVIVVALGIILFLAVGITRWIQVGKPVVHVNWQLAGKVLYCVGSMLVLGAGMAMIMAFEGLMIPGILVGVVGIMLALGIIPVFRGWK